MKIKIFLLGLTVFLFTATSCNNDDDGDTVVTEVPAIELASLAEGGVMYDKFWAVESGFDQNNANIPAFNAAGNFFRCKQCHGWDGLGNAGAYISRAASASRPNVSSLNLFDLAKDKSYDELFESLKKTAGRRDISTDLTTYDPDTNNAEGDRMPNLNQIFTDDELWDLVKFLKDGMFDVTELYDATYTGAYPTGSVAYSNVGKDGDDALGKAYYAANCSSTGCHGADGKAIAIEGLSVGQFFRNKPYETQHKVKYGQPGSIMVPQPEATIDEIRNLYKAGADVTAFPDL